MTTTVTRRQLGGIVGLAGIAGTGLWLGGFPGVLSRTGNGAVLRSSAPSSAGDESGFMYL